MSALDTLHRLAARLEQQPSRPADVFDVRGYARGLGLAGDWLDLLPPTDGATHYEYAARLREIAAGGDGQ